MKKNRSSKKWVISQHRDQYFKIAKKSGFRSRSAYKLLELDNKFKFLKNCKKIVDLGSYPGGWSQMVKKRNKNCKILAIDTKEMEKIEDIEFLCCDFQKENSKEIILKKLSSKVDAVISDMAANTTGNKDLDCIRTNELCAEVIEFSRFALNANGSVLAKLFNGKDFKLVQNIAEKNFKKVRFFKPESSRDFSKETYIHCKGIKTL